MVQHPGDRRQRLALDNDWSHPVGLLLFALLAALVATFGFWDTLSALLGAAGIIALVVVLAVVSLGLAGYVMLKRRSE